MCIPEGNVIIIDESLPEDVVAFFDAFGNATHTALMWNLVGEDVLITGAGPIGIIAAGICKYAGARRVVITDMNDYRLDLARKMGADAAVNIGREDLREIMHKQGLVEGFDIGLEMSGSGAGPPADDLRHAQRRQDQPPGHLQQARAHEHERHHHEGPDPPGHLRPEDGTTGTR